MDFEEFKNRIKYVFRKKEIEPFSFEEDIRRLFLKNTFHIDELEVIDDTSFKAKVSRVDWRSESKEKLPYVRRDIVGRVVGREYVLLVDETINEMKYYYFEIYDRKYNKLDTLWLGDFLYNLNDRYYVGLLRAFNDDLSPTFAWKVKEKAKVLKKTVI